MSIDDVRDLIRAALNDSFEVAYVSDPEQEDPGEVYFAAVSGEDFAIKVELA